METQTLSKSITSRKYSVDLCLPKMLKLEIVPLPGPYAEIIQPSSSFMLYIMNASSFWATAVVALTWTWTMKCHNFCAFPCFPSHPSPFIPQT